MNAETNKGEISETAKSTLIPTDAENIPAKSDKAAYHRYAVSHMAGGIVKNIRSEADRNFDIGREFLEHARWQKENFPNYSPSEFDTLVRDVRAEVRIYVNIKPESIRVDDWARAYLLRQDFAEAIGTDRAALLTLHEYLILIGKCYTFSKKTLDGTVEKGWLGLVREVTNDRFAGIKVSADEFNERVTANEKRLEEAKNPTDPVKLAEAKQAESYNAAKAKTQTANKNVTTSVSKALKDGALDPVNVLAIVEECVKSAGKTLPDSVGFDPAKATKVDCHTLATAMYAAGKYQEICWLIQSLRKVKEKTDLQRKANEHNPTIPLSVEPDSVKLAKEQVIAESRLDGPSKPGDALDKALGMAARERQTTAHANAV
jgi:hypothetical protein